MEKHSLDKTEIIVAIISAIAAIAVAAISIGPCKQPNETITINGMVTDISTNDGIAYASVMVIDPRESTKTDVSGNFSINIVKHRKDIRIRVEKIGYASVEKESSVNGPVFIQLSKTGIFTGYVRDINEKPIKDASITVMDNNIKYDNIASTDDNGLFTIHFLNGISPGEMFRLKITHRDFKTSEIITTLNSNYSLIFPLVATNGNRNNVNHTERQGQSPVRQNQSPNEQGESSGNSHSSVNDPIITTEKMCSAKSDTKGIIGVEITFTDTRSGTVYKFVSDGDDLVFEVPCYLMGESVRVVFKKNGVAENRNVKLKEFEVPEMFRTN